jgi:hypothetical protein
LSTGSHFSGVAPTIGKLPTARLLFPFNGD